MPITIDGTQITFDNATVQSTSAFPAGTLMLFQQTNAPTGWTKQTTHDNKALRVVSGAAGSGGINSFTTIFAAARGISVSVGSWTLALNEIPNHGHSLNKPGNMAGNWSDSSGNPLYAQFGGGPNYMNYGDYTIGTNGGGASHSHSGSGTADFNVAYVDLIIASKS